MIGPGYRYVKLVQHLRILIHRQHVAIAGIRIPAFHESVERNGVGPGIALVAVIGKVDGNLGLRLAYQ